MFQDSGFKMGEAGGYMPSTQQSPNISQSKKTRSLDTVTPITIANIYKGFKNDEEFKLGDTHVTTVTFVGVVTSVNVQSTTITYEFDDMTDKPIAVKHWLHDANDMYQVKPLMENTYARVVGGVRCVKGETFVLSHNLIPLTDMNELTTHLLEVIHARLVLNKRLNQQTSPAAANPVLNSTAGFAGSFSNSSTTGYSAVQAKVLSAIKTCTDDRGCDINYIKQVSKLSNEEIKKALEMLQDEGHIFPTIDNYHFASSS